MNCKPTRAALAAMVLLCAGTGMSTADTAAFDTSFAVESSYSCLGGGCHERNAELLADYTASFMTHVLVKCNACHGTHTAAELGLPKPNLTGYRPGIGATGYTVGRDRCLVCHMSVSGTGGHPRNPGDCTGCHGPHAFKARR